mmetsp:Transcript_69338/g.212576  ORF Transcript_69338/g.212576 Transcript_69338/m.212576 type:complete len:222 (-) Transcript_69338:776-1441(-)
MHEHKVHEPLEYRSQGLSRDVPVKTRYEISHAQHGNIRCQIGTNSPEIGNHSRVRPEIAVILVNCMNKLPCRVLKEDGGLVKHARPCEIRRQSLCDAAHPKDIPERHPLLPRRRVLVHPQHAVLQIGWGEVGRKPLQDRAVYHIQRGNSISLNVDGDRRPGMQKVRQECMDLVSRWNVLVRQVRESCRTLVGHSMQFQIQDVSQQVLHNVRWIQLPQIPGQ